MKKIVIIIALTLFLKPIFPVIEYVVNYDYITKVLCVNKDKAKMHCNGKCHLMKQLAKEVENDKPIAPNKKSGTQETETLFYIKVSTYEMPHEFAVSFPKANTHYDNLYDYLTSYSTFHPPTV
jgi:hypothetical protein